MTEWVSEWLDVVVVVLMVVGAQGVGEEKRGERESRQTLSLSNISDTSATVMWWRRTNLLPFEWANLTWSSQRLAARPFEQHRFFFGDGKLRQTAVAKVANWNFLSLCLCVMLMLMRCWWWWQFWDSWRHWWIWFDVKEGRWEMGDYLRQRRIG